MAETNGRTTDPVAVRLLAREDEPGGEVVRLSVCLPDGERQVFYRFRGAPVQPDADAWAALALPLAMRLGTPLRLEDPISAQVAAGLRQLVDIYACWYPGVLSAVPLEIEIRPTDAKVPSAAGTAAFFSGGVDSFYCAQKHRDELTHLLFVHGFDIPLRDNSHRDRAAEGVRKAAHAMGVALVEVETNIRDVTDRYLGWGSQYLTAAMAPAALLLGGTVGRCYVPTECSYAQLRPYGLHPITTPAYSSHTVTLVHTGAEVERLQRIRALLHNCAAQQYLRVCWKNVPGEYNCQQCHKCLATMCILRILGGLDSFTAFRRPLDLKAVVRLRNWHTHDSWASTLSLVQQVGTDPELEQALLSLRRESILHARLRALTKYVPDSVRRFAGSTRRWLRSR